MQNNLGPQLIAEARRGTITAQRRRNATPGKPPLIGHDIALRYCKDHGTFIEAVLMSNGELFTGKLVDFDKYTITLQPPAGRKRTLYKHALESFVILDGLSDE